MRLNIYAPLPVMASVDESLMTTFYPDMFPPATEKSLIPIRVFSEGTG
jgi:hypothetical protein